MAKSAKARKAQKVKKEAKKVQMAKEESRYGPSKTLRPVEHLAPGIISKIARFCISPPKKDDFLFKKFVSDRFLITILDKCDSKDKATQVIGLPREMRLSTVSKNCQIGLRKGIKDHFDKHCTVVACDASSWGKWFHGELINGYWHADLVESMEFIVKMGPNEEVYSSMMSELSDKFPNLLRLDTILVDDDIWYNGLDRWVAGCLLSSSADTIVSHRSDCETRSIPSTLQTRFFLWHHLTCEMLRPKPKTGKPNEEERGSVSVSVGMKQTFKYRAISAFMLDTEQQAWFTGQMDRRSRRTFGLWMVWKR